LVTYTDGSAKRHQREVKAETLKEARRLLKQTIQELGDHDDITTTGKRIRERRGSLFARVMFTDESGRRREIERRAKNPTDAKDIIKGLLRDLDDHGQNWLMAHAWISVNSQTNSKRTI
jgi:hypothetical protein